MVNITVKAGMADITTILSPESPQQLLSGTWRTWEVWQERGGGEQSIVFSTHNSTVRPGA